MKLLPALFGLATAEGALRGSGAAHEAQPLADSQFPLYLQCDPAWGGDEMGVDGDGERATICEEGCAMTSLSMAVAGLDIALPDGSKATPGSVNDWLEKNGGYVCDAGDCNNLVLTAPEEMTGGALTFASEAPAVSRDEICAAVEQGDQVVLAHVHDSGHFVLVTGCPDSLPADQLAVNDPYYNTTAYEWGDISDTITYSLTGMMSYPLFSQGSPAWGGNLMVTTTVSKVGCLMSSTAMALNGYGITIDGDAANPGTLNAWLRDNNGYTDTNDFIESSVQNISTPGRVVWPEDAMHTTNDLDHETLQHYLSIGRVVIANVMNGGHFVLGVDCDDELLYVNDPGFPDTTSYTYHNNTEGGDVDVVGWRIFDMH